MAEKKLVEILENLVGPGHFQGKIVFDEGQNLVLGKVLSSDELFTYYEAHDCDTPLPASSVLRHSSGLGLLPLQSGL